MRELTGSETEHGKGKPVWYNLRGDPPASWHLDPWRQCSLREANQSAIDSLYIQQPNGWTWFPSTFQQEKKKKPLL